jgi:hypothetical protein
VNQSQGSYLLFFGRLFNWTYNHRNCWIFISKDDFEEVSPLEQIEQILKGPATPDDVLTANVREDDDSWLYIDQSQLDNILNARDNNTQVSNVIV